MDIETGNATSRFNKTMIPLFLNFNENDFAENVLNNEISRREIIDELIRNIYCYTKQQYADQKHQKIYEGLLKQNELNDKQKLYLFASLHTEDIEYMESEIKRITELTASYTEAKQKIYNEIDLI